MKEKFKSRYDSFSDAIIAIIITIMALELPVQNFRGDINIANLFQGIGIYAISFCFVANVWFQHTQAFNEMDQFPNYIYYVDLILIFFLSLLPTFTKMMLTDFSKKTVILYGLLYLIITIMLRVVIILIIREKYRNRADLKSIYQSIYSNYNLENGVLIFACIIIANFFPRISLIFFIIIPVRSFFSNAANNQEFNEISKASPNKEDQKEFLNQFQGMSRSQQQQFHRDMVHFIKSYMKKQNNAQYNKGESMTTAEVTEFISKMTKKYDVNEKVIRGMIDNAQHRRKPERENNPWAQVQNDKGS